MVDVFRQLRQRRKVAREERVFQTAGEVFNTRRLQRTVLRSLMMQYSLYHLEEH